MISSALLSSYSIECALTTGTFISGTNDTQPSVVRAAFFFLFLLLLSLLFLFLSGDDVENDDTEKMNQNTIFFFSFMR